MYTCEMVMISPGATFLCGVIHVPEAQDELCFVNTKAGLGLLFNVFERFNQDSIINSLSIVNKTELLITIQRSQQVGSLHLVETFYIPGNI